MKQLPIPSKRCETHIPYITRRARVGDDLALGDDLLKISQCRNFEVEEIRNRGSESLPRNSSEAGLGLGVDPAIPPCKRVGKSTVESVNIQQMEAQRKRKVVMVLTLFVMMTMFFSRVRVWTGEIHGRVVCDVCGDSSIGPKDHILEDAEEYTLSQPFRSSNSNENPAMMTVSRRSKCLCEF